MSMSQTQKVRISFVEQSSHMNLLNNLSTINKQDDSSLQVSSHATTSKANNTNNTAVKN